MSGSLSREASSGSGEIEGPPHGLYAKRPKNDASPIGGAEHISRASVGAMSENSSGDVRAGNGRRHASPEIPGFFAAGLWNSHPGRAQFPFPHFTLWTV